MTHTKDEALKLALEALQKTQLEGYNLPATAISKAITAIEAALAQDETSSSRAIQEPVAHCTVRPLRPDESYPKSEIVWVKGEPIAGPLYTQPAAPVMAWIGKK
jgi:hypothetical protein